MNGLVFESDKLQFRSDLPVPKAPGEALIKTRLAGICNTDIEIIKGYMGFSGVLGHEFVGEVVECPNSCLAGKRVVGEINCSCGKCDYCLKGMKNHCSGRSVLGILNRPGCFAEYLCLPTENLHLVPDSVSDEEAVFTEPLAAACRIAEQIDVVGKDVLVIGDGKLGLLISMALSAFGAKVSAKGKHPEKLAVLEGKGVSTYLPAMKLDRKFDIVVETSGNAQALAQAVAQVRPQGTIALKTTSAEKTNIHLAQLVIDEITLIGSRCGPFDAALKLLESKKINVSPLIDSRFPLSQGLKAFKRAGQGSSLKVLLDF